MLLIHFIQKGWIEWLWCFCPFPYNLLALIVVFECTLITFDKMWVVESKATRKGIEKKEFWGIHFALNSSRYSNTSTNMHLISDLTVITDNVGSVIMTFWKVEAEAVSTCSLLEFHNVTHTSFGMGPELDSCAQHKRHCKSGLMIVIITANVFWWVRATDWEAWPQTLSEFEQLVLLWMQQLIRFT